LSIPDSIIALDVETTGLHSRDRIVSLGAWRIQRSDVDKGYAEAKHLHIVTNPGRKSHPRAEQVHGYSEWALRHQQSFAEQAQAVKDFLSSGDLIVAHNASFDLRFVENEFALIGMPSPVKRRFCTMSGFRQSGRTGRASLNAICEQIGLQREGHKHSALEDAWFSLMIFLWLQNINRDRILQFSELIDRGISKIPSNFCNPPTSPEETELSTHYFSSETLPKSKKAAFDSLLSAVRPTAILLLEIARSDAIIADDEIELLTHVIHTLRDQNAMPADAEVEHEVLAELFELNLSQNLLTRAARSLCSDPLARHGFPKWLAGMATLDGQLTPSKRAAIDRVKAAIGRVL
jgi:DNA polymerase III epsilon subunit-like protein